MSHRDDAKPPLLRVTPDQYGPDFSSHLLEQYKLYVEMADHVSERRTSANNYLLTVNSFLITLYSLASSLLSSAHSRAWQFLVPLAGILICFTWLILIRSYRELNSAKFKVIHEIEQHLPAAIYSREWYLAERGRGRRYIPLTHLEPYVAWVLIGLYIVLEIIAFWKK